MCVICFSNQIAVISVNQPVFVIVTKRTEFLNTRDTKGTLVRVHHHCKRKVAKAIK